MPEPVSEQSSPYIQEQTSDSPRHDKPVEDLSQHQVHTFTILQCNYGGLICIAFCLSVWTKIH